MRVVFLAAAGLGAGLVLRQVLRQIDDLVSAPRRRFRSRHGDVGVGPTYVSKTAYGVVGGAKPPALRDVPTLVAEMRDAFESGVTLPLEHRRATLRAMHAAFAENAEDADDPEKAARRESAAPLSHLSLIHI